MDTNRLDFGTVKGDLNARLCKEKIKNKLAGNAGKDEKGVAI